MFLKTKRVNLWLKDTLQFVGLKKKKCENFQDLVSKYTKDG